LDNEKDIFDLFRESSEDFTEQPPAEAWTRLEKRLVTVRKRKRPVRKPLQLQLPVIIFTVILLFLIAITWFLTHQHQEILRGRKEFAQLHFLKGQWQFSEKKTVDIMTWDFKDSLTLMGEKSLYFTHNLLSKTPVAIKNQGKNNVLVFNNKTYMLQKIGMMVSFFYPRTRKKCAFVKPVKTVLRCRLGRGLFLFLSEIFS
jgi:hypothetical protein